MYRIVIELLGWEQCICNRRQDEWMVADYFFFLAGPLEAGAFSTFAPSDIQDRSASPNADLGASWVPAPSKRRRKRPTRPSSTPSPIPRRSVLGAHSGLLVTSRVRRRIAGVGAVVYEVNVEPSERTTFWGKMGGRGLGSEVLGLRWFLLCQGVGGRWYEAARDDEGVQTVRMARAKGVDGRESDMVDVAIAEEEEGEASSGSSAETVTGSDLLGGVDVAYLYRNTVNDSELGVVAARFVGVE